MLIDLCNNDYMHGYEVWVHHGEDPPPRIVSEVEMKRGHYDRMEEMKVIKHKVVGPIGRHHGHQRL